MAQTVAGSVTSLTGDVRIQRAGTTVAATPGTAVDVSDRLITGPNSRVTVTLTDNSRIELDESTSLVIDQQMAHDHFPRYQTELVHRVGAFVRLVHVSADSEFRSSYA